MGACFVCIGCYRPGWEQDVRLCQDIPPTRFASDQLADFSVRSYLLPLYLDLI